MKHIDMFESDTNIVLAGKYKRYREYHLRGMGGTSRIRLYSICPGIYIVHSIIKADYHNFNLTASQQFLRIDFCVNGRAEWQNQPIGLCYQTPQDIVVTNSAVHAERYAFPSGYYEGVSILLFADKAKESINHCFAFFDIDVDAIRQSFFTQANFTILREEPALAKPFAEIYQLLPQFSLPQIRLRLMEILQTLTVSERTSTQANYGEQRVYYQRAQIEKVRSVHAYLCENTDKRKTLQELSQQFDIPLKVLKGCFKQEYGEPIYAYIKHFRLDKAALLLSDTSYSVLQISQEVGYESSSKFAGAFKKQFGITPVKYRKQRTEMEHF